MSAASGSLRERIERIINGDQPPGALAAPLSIAGVFCAAGARLRNTLYDAGVLSSRAAPCRVISVGNLTVGGSGKTPFVELVAGKLAGEKIGVLSRGYQGRPGSAVHVVSDGKTLGPPPPVSADEAYMLARKLPGAPVVCAPDRAAGARTLAQKFGVEVIVLDDGFQTRSLRRDLDILLIDARRRPGESRHFPRGALREPLAGMGRADLIALTGAESATEENLGEWEACIARFTRGGMPVIRAAGEVSGWADPSGGPCAPPDGPVFAFCGVARPEGFAKTIDRLGLGLAGFAPFADHHFFTPADVERINAEAKRSGAKAILTTEKDAVRLAAGDFALPVRCPVWKMSIVAGEGSLDEALREVIGQE